MIENLLAIISKAPYSVLSSDLLALRKVWTGDFLEQVRLFDNLAETLWANKSLAKPVVDGLQQELIADRLWNFFMNGASDASLVKPDEYSYARNFIHAPFWTAILFSKLSTLPPPVSVSGKPQVCCNMCDIELG